MLTEAEWIVNIKGAAYDDDEIYYSEPGSNMRFRPEQKWYDTADKIKEFKKTLFNKLPNTED